MQEAIRRASSEFSFDSIEWEPYLLNAKIPLKGGMNQEDYYKAKGYGSVDEKTQAEWSKRLSDAGKPYGASFLPGRKMFNTIPSHRLFEFVRSKYDSETMDKVTDKIFKSYFSEGKDISDSEFLSQSAAACGVDEAQVRELLSNDKAEPSVASVLSKDKRAKEEYGVDGVPFFIFNNATAFSGAQDPETFLSVFKKLKEKNIVYTEK